MSFIIGVIVLIVVAIICRALRRVYEAVDWIVYLLILIAFVAVWISDGFWMGLLIGFIGCLAAYIFFGIGSETEVKKFGRKYTMKCDKCGYGDLEIVEHTPDGIVTRCRRCGDKVGHILNH